MKAIFVASVIMFGSAGAIPMLDGNSQNIVLDSQQNLEKVLEDQSTTEFFPGFQDFLCEYICPNHPMCGGGEDEY